MDITKIASTLFVGSLLSFGAVHSNAEYYMGVEFGAADHDANIDIVAGSGSITDSDSSSKLFFGYHFTPSIALEFQYANLGESASSFTDGSTVKFGNANIDILAGEGGTTTSEATSLGISGVYRFNAGGTTRPFVKLGLHSWDVDNSTTSTGLVASDTSGTDIFYGVGLDISIAKQWALSVSYDVYDIDNDLEGIDEISTFGAGIHYKF
jgi:outer membrane protein W